MKDVILIVISILVATVLILSASHFGAQDRSFAVKDEITGNVHDVTERSIEACKSMPHYAVVVLDGVERRCIKNKQFNAYTKE